jgi:hypothetical protein
MRTPDPFRRAAVLALAWWLVGLGIDTNADPNKDRVRSRRPAAAAEGWRAQATHPEAAQVARPTTTPSPPTP